MVLNSNEQSLCERELSIKECSEALKSMVPDKSPGTDGLPCEFYKVFWNDVADILINSFNCSYEMGKLSISQRRGIILARILEDNRLFWKYIWPHT